MSSGVRKTRRKKDQGDAERPFVEDNLLPFELISLIAKFLIGYKSLKKCTQLNRTWRAASRPSLFYRISMGGRRKKTFKEFQVLLEETPEVVKWLHELVLVCTPRALELTEKSWIYDFLETMPHRLLALRSLEFHKFSVSQLSSFYDLDRFLIGLDSFPAVTEFHLKDGMMSGQFVQALMSSLPRVRIFEIDGCIIKHGVESTSKVLNRVGISELVLKNITLDDVTLLPWFTKTNSTPLLGLDIETDNPEYIHQYGKLIKDFGPGLRKLKLRLRFKSSSSHPDAELMMVNACDKFLDLSPCIMLQWLDLQDPGHPVVVQCLKKFSALGALENVTFEIASGGPSGMVSSSYKPLDEYLLPSKLSTLHSVCFWFANPWDEYAADQLESFVKRHCPGLGRRRLLRFRRW